MISKGDVVLLRDKKTIRIAGKPNHSSEFFVEILKICSKFCKEFIGNVYGLDFHIEESDKVHLCILINGSSKETLMKLCLQNSVVNRPETIIHLDYNKSFYPIKKEYNLKNKNATKILHSYIMTNLSSARASHQSHSGF